MDHADQAAWTAASGHQDEGLSPQQSLALISEQRAGAVRSLYPNPVLVLSSWGVAWLLGFGAYYLAQPGGRPGVLPVWAASLTQAAASVAALTVTMLQVRRSARGVAGTSRMVGAMYGWSWWLGAVATYAVARGLAAHGLPPRLLQLLWPAITLLVVGLLYLAGGVLWQDWASYGLGAWTLLVGAGSVFLGTPANFALISLAGGGGMLAAAALVYRWWCRVPR